MISITLSTGIVASALDIFTVKKKETEAVADNIINSMWATKGGGSAGMAEDLVSLTAMHPAIVMDTAKESFILHFNYRTPAIITRGLYTFYPLFEVHLCTVTFGLMYG